MLINLDNVTQIYIICGKTDLRRGIDGLVGIVEEKYELDAHCPNLFLFCGTRKDRFKALYWENDGFILLSQIIHSYQKWRQNSVNYEILMPF